MEDLLGVLASVRADPACLAKKIKEGAGDLQQAKLRRGLYWRFFAGLLDPHKPSNWGPSLRRCREAYESRKDEIMIDPSKHEDQDLDTCNPLSMEEDNPYQEFYKVQQLIDEIDMDLERCGIDGVPDDFFQQERILGIMRGVLTVWATDNPDTSYRQGMHEVLGAVILALLPAEELLEKADSGGGDDDGDGAAATAAVAAVNEGGGAAAADAACLRAMGDIRQVEADVHSIFSYIMRDLQKLYRVQTDAEKKAQLAKIKAAAKLSAGGGIAASTDGLSMEAPLQAVCGTVQNKLILAIDRKLYERLSGLRIVPTIYVMKWARLLFLREFPIADIHVVWDFLLWELHRGENLLRCIENMGAAMVFYNRKYLMDPRVGENEALRRLLSFPPVSDVRTLCRQAKVLGLARAQRAELANIFQQGFGGTSRKQPPPAASPTARRAGGAGSPATRASKVRTPAARGTRQSASPVSRGASASPQRAASASASPARGSAGGKKNGGGGNGAAAAAGSPLQKRTVKSVTSSTLKATGNAVKSVGRRIQTAAKSVAARVSSNGRGSTAEPVNDEVLGAMRHQWVKFRMQRFYTEHNPAQLQQVDAILTKYAGRHDLLFRSLHKKYEVEPDPLEEEYQAALYASLSKLQGGAVEE